MASALTVFVAGCAASPDAHPPAPDAALPLDTDASDATSIGLDASDAMSMDTALQVDTGVCALSSDVSLSHQGADDSSAAWITLTAPGSIGIGSRDSFGGQRCEPAPPPCDSPVVVDFADINAALADPRFADLPSSTGYVEVGVYEYPYISTTISFPGGTYRISLPDPPLCTPEEAVLGTEPCIPVVVSDLLQLMETLRASLSCDTPT